MYGYKNGVYTNDDCNIQKTVRMDAETIKIIESYNGRDFSKKLRNLVKDFARQNPDFVRQGVADGKNKD